MIARTWRGATRAQDADRYLEYLNATGLREYRETPGNQGVLALRRLDGDRAEFLLITLWDSWRRSVGSRETSPSAPSSIPRTSGSWWSAASGSSTSRSCTRRRAATS